MINFLKYFLPFLIITELNINFINHQPININNNLFFPIFFSSFFYINFFFNKNQNHRLDLDLFFKFLILFIKTPNFFINYLINIFKKIYIYIFFFKYRHFLNTLKVYLKKYSKSVFLIWRPLFKKTSYFGYYRSNRSKWIK